jgi:hypothetical protein
VDIPADQAAFAAQVFKTGKPVIAVGFGSPYLFENFPQAETWLAAFGISDVAQISVARALFAEIPVRGKSPVTIPGVALKAGFGIPRSADPGTIQSMDAVADKELRPVYRVVEKSIAEKAFPGATLAVGYHGKVSIHELRCAGSGCRGTNEIRYRVAYQSGGDYYARREIGGR